VYLKKNRRLIEFVSVYMAFSELAEASDRSSIGVETRGVLSRSHTLSVLTRD